MFKNLKKLGWFFKERKKSYIIGITVLQIINIIVILPPIIVGKAIDMIAQGSITEYKLYTFLIYMVILSILEYSLGYLWSYYIFLNAIMIDFKLRVKIMKKILKMSKTFFEKFSSGDIMARASSDIDAVSEMLGYGVLTFCDGISYLLVIILAMGFSISWKLTFFSILPLPILTILNGYIGEKIHHIYMAQQNSIGKMNDEVLEHINGIRVVRAYVLEKNSINQFEKTTKEVFDKTLKTEIITALFWPVTKIFTAMCYAIAIGYGSILISNSTITIGQLISFNVYLSYIIWPMFAIGDFINTAQRGSTSIQRIYSMIDEKDNISDGTIDELEKNIDIRFDNYSFSYPSSDIKNLKNINIDITNGKTLGIVGHTGSGKTTLIRQLLRQYICGDGDIFINKIPIQNIKTQTLMKKIGYVPQDNILFSKSIRENILSGKKDATIEEINYAIDIADLQKDIDTFSKGLDTIVGERGISISGGQKQRLSIARAIIKKPDILIMDDSLSAVDAKTQMNIIENIKNSRKNKTTIISTHNLSAISYADEIIVLENGKIIQRGTHEKLMNEDGWYKEQYNVQLLKEDYNEQ